MKARAESFRTSPMPRRRERLAYERSLSERECRALVQGLIPRSQEDRWFAYEEGGGLSLHRSWTGFCIYRLRLERRGDEWIVAEAWVNRDAEQHASSEPAHDASRLDRLPDRIIDENTRRASEGDTT